MSKFASGKFAYAISDRSGQRYRYKDMRKEWNGALVGKDEFESKHPQLGPFRSVIDAQAIKDARPSRVEPKPEVILKRNPFSSGSYDTSIITITEPGHGRSTGDLVRFRKTTGFDGFLSSDLEQETGFSITVVTSDTYTIGLQGAVALVGNQRGGGDNATAGPVTLEA
jgi:hypothetical protein